MTGNLHKPFEFQNKFLGNFLLLLRQKKKIKNKRVNSLNSLHIAALLFSNSS